MLPERPSAPSCTCISGCYNFRNDELEINLDGIEEFPFFCKRLLSSGSYPIDLCEHYGSSIDIFPQKCWICSDAMYLYFGVQKCTFLGRHMEGFRKYITQLAVVARRPGTHLDRFVLQFNCRLRGVNLPSRVNSAFISNMTWPSLELPKYGS